MINIYFGERVIHLTDENKEYYSRYNNRKDLRQLIEKFAQSDHPELYIYDDGLNDLYKNFRTCFTYIEAAGGIVNNSDDKILIIKAEDTWQLPKGKVESDESFEEAACREVSEECGIHTPIIVKQLPSTFHTYKKNDVFYLKRTYWFKMVYKGEEQLVPQEKENITDARWIAKSDIFDVLKNTYKSLNIIWKSV